MSHYLVDEQAWRRANVPADFAPRAVLAERATDHQPVYLRMERVDSDGPAENGKLRVRALNRITVVGVVLLALGIAGQAAAAGLAADARCAPGGFCNGAEISGSITLGVMATLLLVPAVTLTAIGPVDPSHEARPNRPELIYVNPRR
jgi:hypothetical protein